MKRLFSVLWLAILLGFGAFVVGHATVVLAKPSEANVKRARDLMSEGQGLFKQGRYRDAMLKFEEAYQTRPAAAFLYNAAFAAEKSGDLARAIARYNEYLAADPTSPYGEQVREKVRGLEAALSEVPTAGPQGGGGSGEGGAGEGGAGGGGGGDGGGGEGGAGGAPEAAPIPADEQTLAEIRSLVIVESMPPGAPLVIYERMVPTAAPFKYGAANRGWRKIVSGVRTPRDLSLKVGHYHIVVDKYQDYNPMDGEINLSPGHVYTFKAGLSQGEFLGQLFLKTNIEQARVYIDDPPPHQASALFRGTDTRDLNQGEHELWVEAPGYVTQHRKFSIKQAETTELKIELERVGYGYLLIEGNASEVEIEIDDKVLAPYQSSGKARRVKLPAGRHKLFLDADGRKVYEGEIDVPRGQELPVRAKLIDSYPRGKAILLGVLSAGAAVGGVFLHLEAQKPNKHGPDVIKVFEISRFAAWGASGLFAGLSVFYSIYDPHPDSYLKDDKAREFSQDEKKKAPPPKHEKAKARVGGVFAAPAVSPDTAGLVFGGFF